MKQLVWIDAETQVVVVPREPTAEMVYEAMSTQRDPHIGFKPPQDYLREAYAAMLAAAPTVEGVELPERQPHDVKCDGCAYCEGWNACLDAIDAARSAK